VNKRTAKISTSGIAMLHGYSRQRRTMGSFSATAGLVASILTRSMSRVPYTRVETFTFAYTVRLQFYVNNPIRDCTNGPVG